jgi:flagellar basal-body rod modification protein FlgD
MSYKILLASLFILSINPLSAAAYCPKGNPRSTDYIRRQPPNRCEGVKLEPISGNSLSLISIATRNIANYEKTLTLLVPRIKNGKNPQVIVKSLDDSYHYQLDDLLLSNNGANFGFSWDTYVLRQAKIPTNKLRAVASYSLGSQNVYVPVTLGQTSGKYEFVFYSQDRVKFTSLKILPLTDKKDQKPVYSTSRTTPNSGEISFTWDGSKAPAGRYKLHYIAFIDRINEPSDRIEKEIVFEHNPTWLKK